LRSPSGPTSILIYSSFLSWLFLLLNSFSVLFLSINPVSFISNSWPSSIIIFWGCLILTFEVFRTLHFSRDDYSGCFLSGDLGI
jgi:hypothetical protein